ncbi:hypothetical protein [Brevundimonas sp. UBA7534]|uniref:hypothetical protein n=1 Tax=Brevundimonas sp. UBA7534 TaxID=1946138 RepID=UPI0025BA67C4|nr:hypothetical protein [Brevundimonas sp. UBA7534]
MSTAAISLVILLSGGGTVQAETSNPPSIIAALMDCREIGDESARLSCYDHAVARLSDAQAQGDVVVMDREAIQDNERRTFGLGVRLWRPQGERPSPEEIQSIASTLVAARKVGPGGRWLLTLGDGSVWLQIDTASPYITRASGQPVTIRRGAFGSYRMTVGNGVSFSVRRQIVE